ncbi:hypothetical protein FS842_009540 [Serendipita sp. 407]|nr:hypothetical protein FS842_009540 [Serendipita sp. 407]
MQSIYPDSHHQRSPPNQHNQQQQQLPPPLSLSTQHQNQHQQGVGGGPSSELVYDAHSPQSTGSPEPPPGILTDAEVKLWELAMAIHSVQTRFNRPMVSSMTNGTNGLNGTAPVLGGIGGIGGSGGAGGLNSSTSTNTHQQLLLAVPIQEILQKMLEVDEIAAVVETTIPRQAIESRQYTPSRTRPQRTHRGSRTRKRLFKWQNRSTIRTLTLPLSLPLRVCVNGTALINHHQTFRNMLGDALAENFPELASLKSSSSSTTTTTTTLQDHAVVVKQEEL